MNELALIFGRIGVDTGDVLAAAGTKWNFLPFRPGLVGGHCIGVDPYYLTHKAERLNYNPQLVLAGRRVNDDMGRHIARECVRLLLADRRSSPAVTVLGMTFKEDVPDIRNSRVIDSVTELESFGIASQVCDPHADPDEVLAEYGRPLVAMDRLEPADAVILAVAHRSFADGGWPLVSALLRYGRGSVLDVKGVLDRSSVPAGVSLWRL